MQNSNKSYIGQTSKSIDQRWIRHLSNSKNNSNLHFHRAIRKYGPDNFIHEILFTTHNQNIISEAEIFLIDYFNTFNTGYNMTVGGEGTSYGIYHPNYNKITSPETKLKISLAQIGRKASKETIFKISGKNNHKFVGYYVTPWGKFLTSRDSLNSEFSINANTIWKWCKNSNKKITKTSINQSKYLQSLNESPLGKTFRDIGFSFKMVVQAGYDPTTYRI